MPQLDQVDTFISQLFWLFVSFAVIYYFISRVASPKIGDVMRKRHNIISSDIESAAKYKEETEKLNEKFGIELAKVKAESFKIISKASQDADSLYKEQITRADIDLKKEIAGSEEEIIKTKEKVSAELKNDVTAYVEEVLEKIAGVKVDKRVVNKVVVKNS